MICSIWGSLATPYDFDCNGHAPMTMFHPFVSKRKDDVPMPESTSISQMQAADWLPIIIGLIAGTFSSVFLAVPMTIYMEKAADKRKALQGTKKKAKKKIAKKTKKSGKKKK